MKSWKDIDKTWFIITSTWTGTSTGTGTGTSTGKGQAKGTGTGMFGTPLKIKHIYKIWSH